MTKIELFKKEVLESKIITNNNGTIPLNFYEVTKNVIKNTEYKLNDILFIDICDMDGNVFYDVLFILKNRDTMTIEKENIIMKMSNKVYFYETISNNRTKETVNKLKQLIIENAK